MAPRRLDTPELLFGVHSVQEALKANRRRFGALWVKAPRAQRAALASLRALARTRDVPIQAMPPDLLRALERQGARHQGVALAASPFPLSTWEQIWALSVRRAEPPFWMAADRIQDPHNLGAMIRIAENCGVHGVLIPQKRTCPLTAAVSHASAGGLEHMHVTRVANLARALDALQARDVWIGGLAADDPTAQPLADLDLNRPLALVIGHEGQGLSRPVRKACDFLLRLPMYGRLASFNAASAAAIALFLARQARQMPPGR